MVKLMTSRSTTRLSGGHVDIVESSGAEAFEATPPRNEEQIPIEDRPIA